MSKNTQISELINYISVNESGNVVFTTVSAATTNTDKFLVSDSGVLKFRTATQLLSDIGAQASGSYQAALSGTGFVKISGTTISYDNSTYLTTASASSTYQTILTNPVTGTGNINYIVKFTTNGSTIGNSIISDDATSVGINNTAPSNYYNSQLVVGNDSASFGSITMATTATGLNSIFFSRSSSGAGRYRGSISYVQSDDSINFRNNGDALRMTISSSGNLGLGVTPSAGWVQGKALEVGFVGNSLWGRYANEAHFTMNFYYSTSANARVYASTNAASDYEQYNGNHTWYSAPSGTIGTNVSLTPYMTLFSDGNLLLTNSTVSNAGYKLDVNGTGRFSGNLSVYLSTYQQIQTYFSSPYTSGLKFSDLNGQIIFNAGTDNMNIVSNAAGGNITLGTAGTTRLTIASTGAATFSSSISAGTNFISVPNTDSISVGTSSAENAKYNYLGHSGYWGLKTTTTGFNFALDTYNGGTPKNVLTITQAGVATFASSVQATDFRYTNTGYLTYDTANTGAESLVIRKFGTSVLTFNSSGEASFGSNVNISSQLSFNSSALNIYTYGRVGLANAGRIIFNNGTGANLWFGETSSNVYSFTPNAYNSTSVVSMNMSSGDVTINNDVYVNKSMNVTRYNRINSFFEYVKDGPYTSSNTTVSVIRQFHDAVNWCIGGILIEITSHGYAHSEYDHAIYFARYGYGGNTASVDVRLAPITNRITAPYWGSAINISGNDYYRDLLFDTQAYRTYKIVLKTIMSPVTNSTGTGQGNQVYLFGY